MARDGAQYFVDSLEALGVQYLFGNPGTTELPIVKSLAGSDIEYILSLHEDVAVGMAAGYAVGSRHTGADDAGLPIGVVNLHVGPGVAHGLCNVYNASRIGAPLLVTAGNHATTFQSAEPLLAGDLVQMTDQYTKWSAEVESVDELDTYLKRGLETALTPPTGPVFLSLPMDVQRAACDLDPLEDLEVGRVESLDQTAVDEAADAISSAEEPVLVLGDHLAQGGSESIEAAIAFAEAIGARVHGEVLAAEVSFPPDHELWVSPLPPDEDRIRTLLDADTIVLAGVESIVPLTEPTGDLIDSETTVITVGFREPPGLGERPAVAIEGDPGDGLAALAGRLDGVLDPSTLTERRESISAIKSFVDAMLDELSSPIAPVEDRLSKPAVVEVLHEVAPDAYLVDESVTASYPLRAGWDLEPEQYHFAKGSGLGYGVAAAIGVAMTGDGHPVIGYVGDGSYLYYPQALFTAARHDIDLTVLVVDNQSYSILKANMRSMFDGVSEDEFIGMDIEPSIDFESLATAQDVASHRANTQSGLKEALTQAIAHDGPALVSADVHD